MLDAMNVKVILHMVIQRTGTAFFQHEIFLKCQLSYYEAFGLAPAEGMACECIPVVTKERTGMGEFVGDCGFYVPYGDEKATAKAIKKALNAPDELGKKARERIIKMFPLEKRERELLKVMRGKNEG